MRALLPFLLLPLAEIAGFAWVGDRIGALNTVALVLLAGLAGVLILRHQGLDTLRRAQQRMDSGQPPVREAFDGLCLALAGVLLIIPGFITDLMALALFLPPVRGWLFRRGGVMMSGSLNMGGRTTVWRDQGQPRYTDPTVIDADFHEVRPPDGAAGPDELPPPDSRWRPPGR